MVVFSIHCLRIENSQVEYSVFSTYSLVQVDGVLAGDNVGDGRTLLLAGGLDVGHF